MWLATGLFAAGVGLHLVRRLQARLGPPPDETAAPDHKQPASQRE
jgi:hypothetical protein